MSMHPGRQTLGGLTLIELLLVLAVLALLLLQFSAPADNASRQSLQIRASLEAIDKGIAMARHTAVTENLMVTLCPSQDGKHCGGSWHEGSIIFSDRNADRIINDDDRILYRLPPAEAAGSLRFNSFRNRQYLQMTPQGTTNHQNGNFTFCPANGDARLAQQLIISMNGRTRFARDSNGDGVVEDSQGRPLNC